MQDREKIKQLLKDGKINSDQAEMLVAALRESEGRKEKIFRQVVEQRQVRQKKAWGFIGVWFLLFLVAASVLLLTLSHGRLNRDTTRAMRHFDEAAVFLGEGNYEAAVTANLKGVKKAPHFAVGYSALGAAYLGFYETTKEDQYRNEAQKAFQMAKKAAALQGEGKPMNNTAVLFLIIFIVLSLAVVSSFLLALYNMLIKREEWTNESWAQVGTLYQRKVDLIPALLEVVKKYSAHEQATLEGVIRARSHAVELNEKMAGLAEDREEKLKDIEEAQVMLNAGLGKISALSEQYPNLKADVHYQTMQNELRETENLLAKARERYNRNVRAYNTALKVFPYNLLAVWFAFQPKVYFTESTNQ
jgi:LemA protein